MTGGHRAP